MTRHHEVFRSCICSTPDVLVVLVVLQMLAVWRSTLGVSLYVSEPTETKVLVRSPALLEDGGGLSALRADIHTVPSFCRGRDPWGTRSCFVNSSYTFLFIIADEVRTKGNT